MKTIIYYFSGTGNSLFVAEQFRKRIDDSRLVPIVAALNQNRPGTDADRIGLVFPCHGLTVPTPVRDFIRSINPEKADYIFAAATRGGTVFRGFELISRILSGKGRKLDASFLYDMKSNDPKFKDFTAPDDEAVGKMKEQTALKIEADARTVNSLEFHSDVDITGISFTRSPLINIPLEKLIIFLTHNVSPRVTKYFYSDSKCTGCGICERVCLSEQISMKDGRPVWNDGTNCYMCYACLNYCPAHAVQIYSKRWMKSYTPDTGRYPHPFANSRRIAGQKTISSD